MSGTSRNKRKRDVESNSDDDDVPEPQPKRLRRSSRSAATANSRARSTRVSVSAAATPDTLPVVPVPTLNGTTSSAPTSTTTTATTASTSTGTSTLTNTNASSVDAGAIGSESNKNSLPLNSSPGGSGTAAATTSKASSTTTSNTPAASRTTTSSSATAPTTNASTSTIVAAATTGEDSLTAHINQLRAVFPDAATSVLQHAVRVETARGSRSVSQDATNTILEYGWPTDGSELPTSAENSGPAAPAPSGANLVNDLPPDLAILYDMFPNRPLGHLISLLEDAQERGDANPIESAMNSLIYGGGGGRSGFAAMPNVLSSSSSSSSGSPRVHDLSSSSSSDSEDDVRVSGYNSTSNSNSSMLAALGRSLGFGGVSGANSYTGGGGRYGGQQQGGVLDLTNLPAENSALMEDVSRVVAAFPDVDPNYVWSMLSSMSGARDRVERMGAVLLEKKNYPKVAGGGKRKPTKTTRDKPRKAKDFKLSDLDPERDFEDFTVPIPKGSYAEEVLAYLCNNFPVIPKGYIRRVIERGNGHYIYARRELDKAMKANPHPFKRLRGPRPFLHEPTVGHYSLEMEKAYMRVENEVKAIKAEKQARYESAKDAGALLECGCCFDEFLQEDVTACSEACVFCLKCAERAAAEVIGAGKLDFKCLKMGGCKGEFAQNEWKRFLKPAVYTAHVRRIQMSEVKAAGLANLVECPFCDFAVVIENESDKILHCLNPECMKESCRLCKEEAHIPLRCDEVENSTEAAARKLIEEKMTASLVRICHGCKRPFFKDDKNCNHMQCTSCKAHQCYVCGKALKAKEVGTHFGNGKGFCPMYSDTEALNRKRVSEGAREAKKEVKSKFKDVELKVDPTKNSKQRPELW